MDSATSPAGDRDVARLIEIMARLRNPVGGCPWDLAQTFSSIAPYTIEEAYEVAEAVSRGDLLDLRDELGDLLLQVVFHARLAQEQGAFAFGDVVAAINAKLIRRHPHIFGDARDLTPDEVKTLWDSIKAQEKRARAAERGETASPRRASVLDGVPTGLPALARAILLQKKASAVGFDWGRASDALAKVEEEAGEVGALLRASDAGAAASADAIEDEIGDLFFAVANVARLAGVDPDVAIGRANAKFSRRFKAVEAGVAATGRETADASLAEMEALWDAAKRAERKPA